MPIICPAPLPRVVATLCVLTVILCGSPAALIAQQSDTPAARLLEQADTNGDGQLSPQERQAAREKIRQWRQRRNAMIDARRAGDDPGNLPATIDPANTALYNPQPGLFAPQPVVVEHVLIGQGGRRDIPLRISLPRLPDDALVEPGESLPLVVFCHGALGSKDGYQPLVEHWASHGYLVIQPTFGDSISLMTPEQKSQVKSIGQLLASDHVTSQWQNRPREVSTILDRLGEVEQAIRKAAVAEAVVLPVDHERIAVAGHSYGAHTTMLLTGAEPLPPPNVRMLPMRNRCIKAGIALSPQGTRSIFSQEAFGRIATPMLFVTGDNDGSPMPGQRDKKGDWRREAYDHSPEGARYLLWIDDAHHNLGGISGANFPGAGPNAPDHVLLIKSTTLAFLDAHLLDSAEAKLYLASETVREASNGMAHLESKLK